MHYFIGKVCITLYVKYLFSAQNLNQMSTIFLVPTGTAAPCRRREPPVLAGEDAGGEWAVHHTTKYNRAATPQDFAQLRLDEAVCHGTHPTRRLCAVLPKPAAHAAGMGLPSLSGLRQWLNLLVLGDRRASYERQSCTASEPGDLSYKWQPCTPGALLDI